MRILVLGGTAFVGRHFVEAALTAGHKVTLFHRGRTGSGLFPTAEEILGDRDSDLAPLHGRTWDAVVDTCGYVPRIVHKTMELLKHATPHYTFISSISVYRDFASPGRHEGDALTILHEPETEEITAQTYGGLKVLCEQHIQRYFAHGGLIIRPGMVVCPFDHTGRFPSLLARAARGGDMVLPVADEGSSLSDDQMQFIDVRDLAVWTLAMVERHVGGVYNAVSPPASLLSVLGVASAAVGVDTNFVGVDSEFLTKREIPPATLNAWYTGVDPTMDHVWQVDASKARSQGLTFRPLTDTVRDTLSWVNTLGDALKLPISAERETEIATEWRSR